MNSFSNPRSDPGKPNAKKRLRVAFLLADNFTLTAFASFVDVLRLAADEADRSRPINCDWTVLSDTMNPVRSSCGVKVQPDTRLRNAGDYDYIVVVGGLIQEEGGFSSECIAYLKAAGSTMTNLSHGLRRPNRFQIRSLWLIVTG